MTIDELITKINALMTPELDEKLISSLADIEKDAKSLQEDIKKSEEKYLTLKQKYIDNLRNGIVSEEHQEEASQTPKSFEDCIIEVVNKRK